MELCTHNNNNNSHYLSTCAGAAGKKRTTVCLVIQLKHCRLSSSIFNDNIARLLGEALKIKLSIDHTIYTYDEFLLQMLTNQAQLGIADVLLIYFPGSPFENHHPLIGTAFYFMTRHPIKRGHPWENIIMPFEPLLWLGVFLTLTLVSFCLFLLSQFYRVHLNTFLNPRLGTALDVDFFLLTLASCTEPNAFPWFNEKAKSAKILITFWIFSLLFISLAYQSNLRASLLRPNMESPVNTIEDMLERG